MAATFTPDPPRFAWTPSPERIDGSVLSRFLRHAGVADFDALASRADRDPAWLNELVLAFCDFRFYRPYTSILDIRRGIEHADWCIDGTSNIVLNCLDRHRDTPAWNNVFLVWEGEDGTVRRFTYRELESEVARLAFGLHALDVRQGDRVAIYLPNIPEAFVALFAILKLGAIAVPLFSGFGAQPLGSRLQDADVHTVLTADGGWRKGAFLPMAATLEDALRQVPSAQNIGRALPRLDRTGAGTEP
jgi:acetyl-CoA synthetase